MHFGMEAHEFTSSAQKARKAESDLLSASAPQTTKLKQKLWTAAALVKVSIHVYNVVLLTDALSSLQTLQLNRNTDHNDPPSSLASLCKNYTVIMQWIPSNCNMLGNADSVAREGTTKQQVDRSIRDHEVKTALKAKQHSRWMHEHPH